MHINFHLPRWYRAGSGPDAPFRVNLKTYYDLVPPVLSKKHGDEVTFSTVRRRANMLGRSSFAINHHSRFARHRNLNLKAGYLPHFLYLDRRGYSGWSEIATQPFNAEDIDLKQAETYYQDRLWRGMLELGQSKYTQPSSVPWMPDNPILIAMQVPGDSTLELAYLQQHQMLAALVASSLRPLLIKPHPSAVLENPNHLAKLMRLHDPEDGVFVAVGNLHAMINAARLVVCANSGVGIEALLLGKPVVTCGATDYRHLTLEARDAATLVAACEAARPLPSQIMYRYAFWYFGQKMLDTRDDPEALADETRRRLIASAT